MCANGSRTVVITCSTTSASAMRLRLRCMSALTNPGVDSSFQRIEVTIPSTTVPVRTIRAQRPRPRVAYQYGLGPDAEAARRTPVRATRLGAPAAGVVHPAVAVDQPCGQAQVVEPGERRGAEDQRGGGGGVGLQAG